MLKRIAGQVDGVMRMIDDERYCIDILTQIAAIQAALGKVGEAVLEGHMHSCVRNAMESGDPEERDRVVAELMDLLSRSSSLLR